MSLYKEEKITGEFTTWKRVEEGYINNGEIPSISFTFVEKKNLPDGTTVNGGSNTVVASLATPTEEFPIINPETGAEVGTMEFQEIYAILYSLAVYLDQKPAIK
jgi:hypothetical protein